ncbi:MAG: EI24 domain-containing protein [Saprospiraceae bacterium]|nr:EI24 domain-containing protein [Saprospiraceae bacterium]
MLKDFFSGITAYGKALQLIPQLRLWGYIIVPGLMSMLLGAGIIWLAIGVSDNIGGWLISLYPWNWGKGVFEKIANIFGGLLIGAVGLILFKNLVIAIASPIMSPLSEKVEKALRGSPNNVKISISGIISDLIRGIRISIRLIIRELFFTLLLFLLGLIPFFSPFVAGAIFFVQAYYAGAGNIDFALERHFRVRDSVRFVRRYRLLAIGNGVVYLLILLTGIGFLFALPLGVIAGTVETVKRLNYSK